MIFRFRETVESSGFYTPEEWKTEKDITEGDIDDCPF
jgi:hypothetical protein